MKTKADLHNHLKTASTNFKAEDFNRTIDLALERLGPGAVVGLINFHDARYETVVGLLGYERAYIGDKKQGVYVPKREITIVRGQEVPTNQGHLLVLGLGEGVHLKKDRPLEETLDEARDHQGIIVVDHPFHVSGLGPYLIRNKYLLEEIDAIETHNGEAALGFPIGPLPFRANRKAKEFYDQIVEDFPHLGALSNSDGHSFDELGLSWTELESPEKSEEFNNALRKAIRNTDRTTPRKETSCPGYALSHAVALTWIIKVAPKIGLGKRYEIERPNKD